MKGKTPPTDLKSVEYLTHPERWDLTQSNVSNVHMYTSAESSPSGDILENV